jgi:hypothetical protein
MFVTPVLCRTYLRFSSPGRLAVIAVAIWALTLPVPPILSLGVELCVEWNTGSGLLSTIVCMCVAIIMIRYSTSRVHSSVVYNCCSKFDCPEQGIKLLGLP